MPVPNPLRVGHEEHLEIRYSVTVQVNASSMESVACEVLVHNRAIHWYLCQLLEKVRMLGRTGQGEGGGCRGTS